MAHGAEASLFKRLRSVLRQESTCLSRDTALRDTDGVGVVFHSITAKERRAYDSLLVTFKRTPQ